MIVRMTLSRIPGPESAFDHAKSLALVFDDVVVVRNDGLYNSPDSRTIGLDDDFDKVSALWLGIAFV